MTTTDKPPALRQPLGDGLVQWFGEAYGVRVTMIRHEKPGQAAEQWFVRPLHGDHFVGVELVDANGNIGVRQVGSCLEYEGTREAGDPLAEEKAAATDIIAGVMGEPADKAAEIAAALVDAGWRPPETEPYDYDPDYSDGGDDE